MVYGLTKESRSEMLLDLRYVLREPNRAKTLRLLAALRRTIDRELARIRFPVEVLPKLAAEIESVADILPGKSPLIDLGERARSYARVADVNRDRTKLPANRSRAAHGAIPPGMPRSASEEAQFLKLAAAAIEVADISTSELVGVELSSYLNYCMTLEKYEEVIATLLPRIAQAPSVWMWNLLLAAMRLSRHPDFATMAKRFHTWMVANHPEARNDDPERLEMRSFSSESQRFLAQRELRTA